MPSHTHYKHHYTMQHRRLPVNWFRLSGLHLLSARVETGNFLSRRDEADKIDAKTFSESDWHRGGSGQQGTLVIYAVRAHFMKPRTLLLFLMLMTPRAGDGGNRDFLSVSCPGIRLEYSRGRPGCGRAMASRSKKRWSCLARSMCRDRGQPGEAPSHVIRGRRSAPRTTAQQGGVFR